MKAGQRPTDMRAAMLEALQQLASASRREEIEHVSKKKSGGKRKSC
jgi:hypothetical protein